LKPESSSAPSLATPNEFKAGHRICLDITSMDSPTGTGAMSGIPYHLGISKSVTHKVYRDAEHPSHLLLPIIPKRSKESVGR
jgi:predicted acyl esterase